MRGNTNRQSTFAGINVTTNAAGDIASLAGRSMAFDRPPAPGHPHPHLPQRYNSAYGPTGTQY